MLFIILFIAKLYLFINRLKRKSTKFNPFNLNLQIEKTKAADISPTCSLFPFYSKRYQFNKTGIFEHDFRIDNFSLES